MSENLRDFKSPYAKLYPAARWYAQRGYHIFPLLPGTKKPAIPKEEGGKGLYDATCDLAQIERWWREDATRNIGINCGASGLLVVDLDSYKTGGSEATPLTDAELATVTTITAHGGTHKWYRMPVGKGYGNRRGNLPKWIDIKGHGGYVVAAPSVLVEDGRELPYTFAPGYNPADCEIAPLPATLVAILDAAQAGSKARDVAFTVEDAPTPDLAQWRLSGEVLELIERGAPKGERSEADYRVILALLKAGASNDEIRGVFSGYAIGSKYAERGDKYLSHSIGRARQWLEDHPPDAPAQPAMRPQLEALEQWTHSAACVDLLIERGARRPADYAKTLMAIANYALQRMAPRVKIGTRQLGDLLCASHMTAKRHLSILSDKGLTERGKDGQMTHRAGMGLIRLTKESDNTFLVDLTPLIDLLQTVTPLQSKSNVESVTVCNCWVDDHLADEAFVQYPRRFAAARRPAADILPHGLSAAALLVASVLYADPLDSLTRATICERTGLSKYTVGAALRRMVKMQLLIVEMGKPYRYALSPDFDYALEVLRPMLPSYGIGAMRARKNAIARADYLQKMLTGELPIEPREKARAEMRREQYDLVAAAYGDALEDMGINYQAKVMPPRPARHRIKFDAVSEWSNWAKDLWEVLRLLGDDVPLAERVRLLTIAEVGEDADAATYQAARRHTQERVDLALSLAHRRARLERWHMEDDDDPAVAAVMPVAQPDLFGMAA